MHFLLLVRDGGDVYFYCCGITYSQGGMCEKVVDGYRNILLVFQGMTGAVGNERYDMS